MKYYLEAFRTSNLSITDATVHSKVLTDDGLGSATSKRLYKASVRWSIIQKDGNDPAWPQKWFDMSVKDLATKLLEGNDT